MSCLQGNADFTLWFEAANAGPVARARVDNDKRPLVFGCHSTLRRNHAHQGVIYRPLELAAIQNEFAPEFQNMRGDFCRVLLVSLAALLQHVKEQEAALAGIYPIARHVMGDIERRYCGGRLGAVCPG